MFKFPTPLFAGLAGAVVGLLVASAANAAPTQFEEHMAIRDSIVQAGFTTDVDTPDCNEGMMGYVDFPKKEFVLCVDNHRGNAVELMDTIRHEAVHVAQYCMGGLLAPDRKEEFLSRAQDIGFSPLSYEPKAWYIEGEAWVLADSLTGAQTQQLVNAACN